MSEGKAEKSEKHARKNPHIMKFRKRVRFNIFFVVKM